MSWFELERLVEDAEKEPQLARALRHCRSNPELVLAARRLDYRIPRVDLQQARLIKKNINNKIRFYIQIIVRSLI